MSLDSIGAIIAIHLQHRVDRRQSIIKQIDCLGVSKEKCYLFPATFFPFHGSLGCAISHIKALEFAQELQVESVLILEDDFVFLETKEKIEKIFTEFKKNFAYWDVFFLATDICQSIPTKHKGFVKVTNSLCAHAYIVNQAYIPTLIDCFQKSALAMQQDENHKQSFFKAIDRAWHTLQQKDQWFSPIACLGCQGSFSSDISLNHRNRIPLK